MHPTEQLNHHQAERTCVSSPRKCRQHWVSKEPPRGQTFTSSVRVQCWRIVSCLTPRGGDAWQLAPGSLQTWFLSISPWLILLYPFAITHLSYMCDSAESCESSREALTQGWSWGSTPPLHSHNTISISDLPPKGTNICGDLHCTRGFPGGSVIKNLPANAGNTCSIPGSGRSPEGGNGNPLQHSCLGNPMDRGAQWATVHSVTENCT